MAGPPLAAGRVGGPARTDGGHHLRPPVPGADTAKTATGGGPVRRRLSLGNKLVVIAVGATGALRWFAPVQPLLAAVSLVLLSAALWIRLGGEAACRVAAPQAPSRRP
jgi:hypothetical protein